MTPAFFHKHKILLLYSLIGFVVFSNVLRNGFVWLDYSYFIDNPEAQKVNLYALLDGNSLTQAGYYRPIPAIYLAVQRVFFHEQPFFYHFMQTALRIASTYLLFLLFAHFFRKKLAFALALIYLVHPLNESQAAFIMAVADQLYIFFGLIALLFCLRKKQSRWTIIGTSIFLLLSLLTKESGLFFVIIATEIQCLFNKKMVGIYALCDGIILFAYLGIRYIFHGFAPAESELYPMAGLTFFEKIVNMPQIAFFYIEKFFVPMNIGGLHIWTVKSITVSDFWFPLACDILFVVSFILIGWYTAVRQRKWMSTYVLFCTFIVLGFLLYVQIVPLDYTVASRWFAFTMIGLLGVIGVVGSIVQIPLHGKRVLYLVFAGIVCVLALLTWQRNSYWKSDLTLFHRWASIDDNHIIESGLANAYYTQKNYTEALNHATKSVEMFSYDNNLAVQAIMFESVGNLQMATETAAKAMNADNYGSGYHVYATYHMLVPFFLRNNQLESARAVLHEAVIDNPNDSYFWAMLAGANYSLGHKGRAGTEIQRALEISPDLIQVREMYTKITNNLPL